MEKVNRSSFGTLVKSLLHHWNRDWVLGLLLALVTIAAYQPAWNGKPLWDDQAHITRPDLCSAEGLALIWTHPGSTQQYYPLVHSVFWAAYHIWGDSPLGYHLLNILFHILSALLLVRILRFLQVPGAWLAGAIFALHPVQVESVAWITEMKNTLSGVFFLSSALAYLKFDCERKKGVYAIALGLFVLGLLSKSVIATLPVSLLAVFWWKRGKIFWKRDAVPLLPFFVVGIVSGLFTTWMERVFFAAKGSDFSFTIIERCLIAGRALWFYLSKLFWPADLIFIYPRWNISQALWWQYLFPVAVLTLGAALWSLRHRWRAPFAVFLYFTATIFPALGFFNVYSFRYSFVADHFQYLAAIGPLALSAAGMRSAIAILGKKRPLFSLAALYGIVWSALGVLTWRQCGMYADVETLYQTIIRKNPVCWMAHNNLGVLLANNGRSGEAMTHYRKAVEINQDNYEAYNNIGQELFKAGRIDEAITYYRKSFELKPNYADAYYNFGILLANIGQDDEAIANYQKTLEINPNHGEAHCNLGVLLVKIGLRDEAIVHYQKALEINPNSINALNNLAGAFLQKGKLTDAIRLINKSLALAKAEGNESLVRQITINLERLNRACNSLPGNPGAH